MPCMRGMELRDTAEMMNSTDWRERFKAEYHQLRMRHETLYATVKRMEVGSLDFAPASPLELLQKQEHAMSQYLYCLKERAEIEGIEL